VDTKHNTTNIKQTFYQISQDSFKKDSVISILQHHKPNSTIIFCNTKIECDNLADELEEFGLEPLVIHSDLDQKDRTETIILFANRSYPILIATDVASRGLDIDDIDMVINYDMPNNSEVFTHRIGRTARAGKDGLAISLVSHSDQIALEELEDYLDTKIDLQKLKIDIDYDFRQTIEYQTLYISGGKKLKLSAGDILGVLLNNTSLTKTDIGKINILPRASYVAIKNDKIKEAKTILSNNKIKGKFFRIYDR
jgi:ATP-independent RNA helicase DbpA